MFATGEETPLNESGSSRERQASGNSTKTSTLRENEALSPSCIPSKNTALPGRDASKGSRSKTCLRGAGSVAAPRSASGPTAASSKMINDALVAFRIPLGLSGASPIIKSYGLLHSSELLGLSATIGSVMLLVTRSNCRDPND